MKKGRNGSKKNLYEDQKEEKRVIERRSVSYPFIYYLLILEKRVKGGKGGV